MMNPAINTNLGCQFKQFRHIWNKADQNNHWTCHQSFFILSIISESYVTLWILIIYFIY